MVMNDRPVRGNRGTDRPHQKSGALLSGIGPLLWRSLAFACLGFAGWWAISLAWRHWDSGASEPPPWIRTADASQAADAEAVGRIRRFCGDCHAFPDPANYPAVRWHHEALEGFHFYARSGRQDLSPPTPEEVVRFYLDHAPELPEFPEIGDAKPSPDVSFRVEKRLVPEGMPLPQIATLTWVPVGNDDDSSRGRLVACDMQYGHIVAMDPLDASSPPEILARLGHPALIRPCDFSGDGSEEFLVADLGSLVPGDHDRGRVVLLRRAAHDERFEPIVLAAGLGRVADVRIADLDGDGRDDFLVAEFGWRETGGIWLYRNIGSDEQPLRFSAELIDQRPGTIHLPIHDFDGDGLPDFAALVSQEFESVDLFLSNRDRRGALRDGRRTQRFDRYQVWSGPDLTFGSSGLEIVDLDGDGRPDFLITSGDAFDNNYVVPSQGVHWLRGLGRGRFEHQWLSPLVGAYSARAGDVDLDGNLDVIAVSLLPREAEPREALAGEALPSIVCLQQTEPGVFVRHVLESGRSYYSSVVVGDFDGDGDLDFAVGSGPLVADGREDRVYLTIWWNQKIPDDRVGP